MFANRTTWFWVRGAKIDQDTTESLAAVQESLSRGFIKIGRTDGIKGGKKDGEKTGHDHLLSSIHHHVVNRI